MSGTAMRCTLGQYYIPSLPGGNSADLSLEFITDRGTAEVGIRSKIGLPSNDFRQFNSIQFTWMPKGTEIIATGTHLQHLEINL